MAGRQRVLSSYFSQPKEPRVKPADAKKSPGGRIDLTLSDSDSDSGAPPAKRTRIERAEPSGNDAMSSSPPPAHSLMSEKWNFTPVTAVGAASSSKKRPAPEIEAFRRKMGASTTASVLGKGKGDKRKRAAVASEDGQSEDGLEMASSEVGDDETPTQLSKFANKKLRKATAGSGRKESVAKATKSLGTKRGSKKVEEVGPAGLKYTPLEKQILALKDKHGDAILMFEVGYKFRFFGEDARVASQELGIACFMDKNFLTASIPVGIIEQVETAALKKAGDNRSAPFDRQLTHLYTAATFVDELGSVDDAEAFAHGAAPPIACIIEELRGGMGSDELVHFGFVAVTPATGDIVYDAFDDTYMRSEIETRMAHVRPLELLLPERRLTKPTEKMLAHIGSQGNRIRVERYKDPMSYTDAFDLVSAFYRKHGEDAPQTASEGFRSGKLMGCLVDFPKNVIIALACLMRHLESFQLSEVFLKTEFFASFTNRSHMLVSANSLHNLEIFRNQTDFTELLLKGLPDLVKGLCRIQYRKATPPELATMLAAWNRIAAALDPIDTPSDAGFQSDILNDIACSLPTLRGPLALIESQINIDKARQDDKTELWVDSEKYPKIDEAKFGIMAVESELEDHLKEIRKTLGKPNIKYISVSGIDFLIEVRNGDTKKVPASWLRINSTKVVTRFHTPEVKAKIQEREVYQETLVAEAKKAFNMFLGEVAEHYSVLRNVTMKLAALDCLSALATIAQQPGYVKPQFFDDDRLDVDGGRHPMVEAIRVDPFVPISCTLGGAEPRTKIITGPNMGGKSSCVRTIALVAILAQIGSYVPCRSAKVGMLDGIATRMGASDEITRGRSTFMVEVSETAEIIKTATPRTLVILDELGRGTSTFDGMAIAHAVMQHLVENVKCKTLFITHYPLIALDLEQRVRSAPPSFSYPQ
ncbi:Mismatch repair protein msh3 [Ceratobasidium sp. 370]|nr:Mismatch repair protein msh3 [Ceratobasidium sp. 370]